MASSDARRHLRRAVDNAATLSWRDGEDIQSWPVRILDLSASGMRVETAHSLPVASLVFVNADSEELSGGGWVRHCTSRGSKFILGLEFSVKRERKSAEANRFVDYYELLQISPNAQPDTIHRVFRMFAARYHPDNPQTGDTERFLLLSEAYQVLSDPKKRLAYDAAYTSRQSEALPFFELKEFVSGLDGETNRRLGILCLLYSRRRTNPDDPGLSLLEFETAMAIPREHLLFAMWYLKNKGCIRTDDNGDNVITAEGVDYVESHLPANRIFYNLLSPGAARGHSDPDPGDLVM